MDLSPRSPARSPSLSGGPLGLLLRWAGENPSTWPLPLLACLVRRQDQLLWALVQRLDGLSDAVRPSSGSPTDPAASQTTRISRA